MAHTETKTEAAPAGDGEKQTLVGNLQIAAFIALVVTLECAVAWFFLPSTGDVAAVAAEQVKKEVGHDNGGHGGGHGDAHGDSHGKGGHGGGGHGDAAGHPSVEMDLGKFQVTATQPVTNTIVRITFSLWGTIPETEETEFEHLYERNKNRIRQEVIFIARQLDAEGLADPNLALLKRKILDKINQVLGKSVVQTVVFSDFSYVDQ